MPFLQRQTTRITGYDHDDERRKSLTARLSTGKVPHAKKPRSRPPTSLRDRLPFPNSSLTPASGPYSVGSMEIEVAVENPHTISHIKRGGRHLLQIETVLFTLCYPAALGSGSGRAPGGQRKWSRETWLPRPRLETAKGYAKFAGIPSWAGIGFFGVTSGLTKLHAYRNCPLATHWPPEGNAKKQGFKIKNQKGPSPQGIDGEPIFPLLMFSHGLGGSRTAYSSLCTEFASYGFVVCAVEHRDGSGPRTFINHSKTERRKEERQGYIGKGQTDGDHVAGNGHDRTKSTALDHTYEELRKGYHHVDYIFPKGNPKDTAPNNEQGVDGELRNAQIEMRLCELEEAYRVLQVICAGDGEKIERQNLRCEGHVGGSSQGLKGVSWSQWKNRFHVDKMTMAGHSFGAATVIEVLRHAERFKNVQAGIIYDIWGAPVSPPVEELEHRINIPLLGINSEAFMYWQSNFDAVQSLMQEASEHGSPAFSLTVRGSVHLSQSDFSVLYKHIVSFLMKATVHPSRAIDLNISASLEFLRLVTPDTGSGKAIIDRCMTDEAILETQILDEIPQDHRPDDEYIAAKLRVNNEFRERMAAGLQRRLKRHSKGRIGKMDEVWVHFKPTDDELKEWIHKEHRGEKRVDEKTNEEGVTHSADTNGSIEQDEGPKKVSRGEQSVRGNVDTQLTSNSSSATSTCNTRNQGTIHRPKYTSNTAASSSRSSNDAPQGTWLGILPTLRDGPQQQ